jgi:hypothetical protein
MSSHNYSVAPGSAGAFSSFLRRALAQYTEAALQYTRGTHDAGGKIIRDTPKEKRQEFAAES